MARSGFTLAFLLVSVQLSWLETAGAGCIESADSPEVIPAVAIKEIGEASSTSQAPKLPLVAPYCTLCNQACPCETFPLKLWNVPFGMWIRLVRVGSCAAEVIYHHQDTSGLLPVCVRWLDCGANTSILVSAARSAHELTNCPVCAELHVTLIPDKTVELDFAREFCPAGFCADIHHKLSGRPPLPLPARFVSTGQPSTQVDTPACNLLAVIKQSLKFETAGDNIDFSGRLTVAFGQDNALKVDIDSPPRGARLIEVIIAGGNSDQHVRELILNISKYRLAGKVKLEVTCEASNCSYDCETLNFPLTLRKHGFGDNARWWLELEPSEFAKVANHPTLALKNFLSKDLSVTETNCEAKLVITDAKLHLGDPIIVAHEFASDKPIVVHLKLEKKSGT